MTSSSSPTAPAAPSAATTRTRVWDLPTRLFHWLLALAVTGVLATGFTGFMDWHFRLGYAVLALLLFRLVWGFAGGHWSRFSNFVHGPRAVLAYLRGESRPHHRIGHNPLGAISVFAMLAILALQVLSGLTADDAITYAGPLAHLVPSAVSDLATNWHATKGHWVVIALVVLHLVALLYYGAVRRQRLVGPMITGDKDLPADVPAIPSRDGAASRLAALAAFAGCVAFAVWIGTLRP